MEQPVALLRNLAQSLKPDGRIGIVDFTSDGGGPGPPMDERVDPAARHPRRRRSGAAADLARALPPLSVHARVREGESGTVPSPVLGTMSAVPAFFTDYQHRVDAELQAARACRRQSRAAIDGLHRPRAIEARPRRCSTLLCAELCGGTPARAVAAAAAIELVHASSLILDDLPAMDDAPLRRGQPSNHLAVRRGDRDPRGVRPAQLSPTASLARAYEPSLASRTVASSCPMRSDSTV